MSARVVRVIVSDDKRAGEGVAGDPVRAVRSIYTLDGHLVCEVDGLMAGYQVNAWNDLMHGRGTDDGRD